MPALTSPPAGASATAPLTEIARTPGPRAVTRHGVQDRRFADLVARELGEAATARDESAHPRQPAEATVSRGDTAAGPSVAHRPQRHHAQGGSTSDHTSHDDAVVVAIPTAVPSGPSGTGRRSGQSGDSRDSRDSRDSDIEATVGSATSRSADPAVSVEVATSVATGASTGPRAAAAASAALPVASPATTPTTPAPTSIGKVARSTNGSVTGPTLSSSFASTLNAGPGPSAATPGPAMFGAATADAREPTAVTTVPGTTAPQGRTAAAARAYQLPATTGPTTAIASANPRVLNAVAVAAGRAAAPSVGPTSATTPPITPLTPLTPVATGATGATGVSPTTTPTAAPATLTPTAPRAPVTATATVGAALVGPTSVPGAGAGTAASRSGIPVATSPGAASSATTGKPTGTATAAPADLGPSPADPGATSDPGAVAGKLGTARRSSGPSAPMQEPPAGVRPTHHGAGEPVDETAGSVTAPSAGPASVPVTVPASTLTTTPPGGPLTTGAVAAPPVSVPVAATPVSQAVATQVFPETARLVGSGDGVHRIVLQLNPKALGEVRVVLTVRAGDVQVRFAAGDEVRAALLATSSDLHRLLEQAGAQSARVEVRDASGAATGSSSSSTTSSTTSYGTPADTGGLSAQGQSRTQDHHHPGTGGGYIATDGVNPTLRRADRPDAGRPFDRALTPGVDLTM